MTRSWSGCAPRESSASAVVIERQAARALLIAHRSVLLIKGRDPARPAAGWWWLTPGGGIEDGEDVRVAAAREVLEETGLHLLPEQFGPVVATRVAHFEFDDHEYAQSEQFFAVDVAAFTPSSSGWDAVEQRALTSHRWWDLADLSTTEEIIYPRELPELIRAVLDGTISAPMQLRGS